MFDRARGQLLAIGGLTTYAAQECCDAAAYFGTVEAWDGATWTPVPTPSLPQGAYGLAWFDPAPVGLGLTAPDGHTYELGATLVDRTTLAPIGIVAVAPDPARGRAIAFTTSSETWAWTDHWERLATPTHPVNIAAMAFDPVRDALIAHEPQTGRLWRFDTEWQVLGPGPALVESMADDYAARRMILLATNNSFPSTWALDSASTVATPLTFSSGPTAELRLLGRVEPLGHEGQHERGGVREVAIEPRSSLASARRRTSRRGLDDRWRVVEQGPQVDPECAGDAYEGRDGRVRPRAFEVLPVLGIEARRLRGVLLGEAARDAELADPAPDPPEGG